jgi:HSP20 family protein
MHLPELGDLIDDVRRLFEELDRRHPAGCSSLAGECTPELDVFETDAAIEVVVDLPGLTADCVRVLIKSGTLVVAGEKAAPDATAVREATFHRLERSFGRFARAVRLMAAIDAARARAFLRAGELVIVVPKIEERRGREIRVPIEP